MRWLRHLVTGAYTRNRFPPATLDAIHKVITASEPRHRGEICFAIERSMPLRELARGRSARERAHEVFAQLRVWDTHANNGVLIYILLAERAIEIVADRGIAARVGESEWKSICEQMQKRFAAGEFKQGAVDGVNAVGDILVRHFPADGSARENELSDVPVML